jgi:hypothetical protein
MHDRLDFPAAPKDQLQKRRESPPPSMSCASGYSSVLIIFFIATNLEKTATQPCHLGSIPLCNDRSAKDYPFAAHLYWVVTKYHKNPPIGRPPYPLTKVQVFFKF